MPFLHLIWRDLRLTWKGGGPLPVILGFYLIVVAILPMGLGPDLKLLRQIAPGYLWVALLLSALLSVERIFHNDFEDGTLELLALGPLPLELVAAAKSIAHWLSTALPLVLLAPVLGIMLNLDANAFGVMILTMITGTPAISFLGAIGAALTLGLRRGALLVTILILPLYIPVLIFGVSSIDAVLGGVHNFSNSFLFLLAMTISTMAIAPFFTAMALRLNLQ